MLHARELDALVAGVPHAVRHVQALLGFLELEVLALVDGRRPAAHEHRAVVQVAVGIGHHGVPVAEVAALECQERGVLREHAVGRRESQDLLAQLAEAPLGHQVATARKIGGRQDGSGLANLLGQERDAACRPQARHEGVARGGAIQLEVERELTLGPQEVADQTEVERSLAAVLPQKDGRAAFVQVGQVLGRQLANPARVQLAGSVDDAQHGLRQDRTVQAPEDPVDGELDVLARIHVRRQTARVLGDAIQERSVHVRAHTKGEDAAIRRVRLPYGLADRQLGASAHGRQPVGEEQHDRQIAGLGLLTQRLDQGVSDVRATRRSQGVEVETRRGDLGRVLDDRLRGEHRNLVRVVDQVEALAVCQAFDHLERRRLGLVQLAAAHRTGAVDHQSDLTARHLAGIGEACRHACHQEEEPATHRRIGVSEQSRLHAFLPAGGARAHDPGEAERPGYRAGLGGHVDASRADRARRAVGLAERVGRRVDRAHRSAPAQGHLDVPRDALTQGLAAWQ